MSNIARLNKKALFGKTIDVAIILLVLISLLVFSGKLYAKVNSTKDREACRSGVAAQATLMSVPGTKDVAKSILAPDCKTYNIRFFDNHVEVNGKTAPVLDSRKKDVVKKFDGLTDEIVNEVLAEELRWCWYQYLEGTRNVLDRKNWIVIIAWSKPTLCVLCDEVSFDAGVKKDTFGGFYQFTKEKIMPNAEKTYYQYYAEGPTLCTDYENAKTNCWEAYFDDKIKGRSESNPPLSQDITFDKKKDYVVVFIQRGLETKIQLAGPSDVAHFAYVLPTDELPNQCGTIQRGSMQ